MIKQNIQRKRIFFNILAVAFACIVASSLFSSIYEDRAAIVLDEACQPGKIVANDMPASYSSIFSGKTTDTNYTASYYSSPATLHPVLLKNGFKNAPRYSIFDLTNSSFAVSGWELYKVQVNLENNQTKAAKDWVNVQSTDETLELHIDKNGTGSNLEDLAQSITQKWRVQVNNITMRVQFRTTNPLSVPAPKLQLWDQAGGVPSTLYYSKNLAANTAGAIWLGESIGYIINASAAANRTWMVVLNGTQWGDSPNTLISDHLYWYAPSITGGGGATKEWQTPWGTENRRFCLAYERLFLNDNNNLNRTFLASEVNLRVNGTAFNNTGSATITGSNIRALNFSSDTTCVGFNVSYKLYYKKVVSSTRTFSIPAPSSPVDWKVTSSVNVTFPAGTISGAQINASRSSGHTITGVFNASTVAGLITAPNYTSYSVFPSIITITGIKSNSTWEIRSQSVNVITGITQIGGAPISVANQTDTVNFSVNVSPGQVIGNMSLGIFYPLSINDTRAFFTSNASFGGSVTSVILPGKWNTLGFPVGQYRIQARWNSTIDAGFREVSLLLQDPFKPVTSLTHNAPLDNNITMTTVFTISATDVGTGVDYTNITIQNQASLITKSWNYEPGNTTFTFLNRNVNAAGLYNVSWFSVDNFGNIEARHSMIVNLTRIPVLTLASLAQPGYNYVDSSSPYSVYYGRNVMARVRFIDDLGIPVVSPDLLNISVNGYSFTTYVDTGSGYFNITMNTASFSTGPYTLTITANKSVLNLARIQASMTILPNLPITTLTHNAPIDNNITMSTNFTISVIDVGTGVDHTNITIHNQVTMNTQSWNYLPGNTTFNFLNRNSSSTAGLYNISWYSFDSFGDAETVHSMIVNLTRSPSISLISLLQADYNNYNDTTSPFSINFGKNATARVLFLDDQGLPVSSPNLLNISVGGQSFIGFAPTLFSGQYDIVLTTDLFTCGTPYTMTITAEKLGLDDVQITLPLTVIALNVTLSVISRTQDGVSLNFIGASEVWEGEVNKNVTIVIRVSKVLNNEPITSGLLNLTYRTAGGEIIFTTTVSDISIGDALADGLYTVILPSVVLQESDARIYFSWSESSGNYVNTTPGASTNSFLVRFKSLINSINWGQLIILIIMLAAIPIIYTAVLKKVVVPRRQERHNFLAKISSAFEDAANIQNVLVIHKASGTCLFFKSYGKTAVDPDLITGFLTAIQSFGAEMSGNKAMEELTWQDYQLVLGEGELIRVALVLASKASMILKTLVPQFVAKYETAYADKLRNWRGDLTSFRDSIKLIDEVFDTSIILPHKRSDLPIKPRTSLAKTIYDLAGVLTRERDYFFIATLLSESIEKTKRSYGEIIAAIQELREDEILVHIDIESLEKKKEMTQQEVVSLQTRVAQISFLNPDEKAKLLQDLMRMSSNEREASLSSMMIMTQLQTATTQAIHGGGTPQASSGGAVTSKVTVASASIQTKKAALNQIKNLDKNAKICLKNFQYEEAIKGFEQAELIASQWDLKDDLVELTHKKIDATVRDYQYRQAVVLAEAKNAEKSGDVATAIRRYQEAANYSSALFKLGISTEDKKMREFVKRAEQLKRE